VDKPLKSVTHEQCDARPTVTLPAAEHYRPLAGTKLYCLVTEAHVIVVVIKPVFSTRTESEVTEKNSPVQVPSNPQYLEGKEMWGQKNELFGGRQMLCYFVIIKRQL